ncbi:MAG: S9 family peptidase [Acidobacteria bacterium]|nr:S9 family peptidase [Acidobacteriota bacterium]
MSWKMNPLFLALLSTVPLMSQTSLQPPVAPRKDHVNTWHGKAYPDPWHWLRGKGTPAVEDYLKAENAYTEAVTKDLKPFSEALYKEMLGRIKQTDLSVPVRRGRYFYYSRTVEGLQYPIVCRRAEAPGHAYDEKAPEEVLLDQNEMAKGLKFLSIGTMVASDHDTKLAYTTDETGFRQYRLFFKDLVSGQVEGPVAERVDSVVWASDNATVFYVTEDPVTKRSDTLWRLKLGGKPEKIFEEKDPLFNIGVGRTKDRKFLVLGHRSTDTWEDRILEADNPGGAFRAVLGRQKGHKYSVDHRGGLLYIRTNRDAKDFRMVTAPVAEPTKWTPFLAARKGVLLQGVELFQDFAVASEKIEGLVHLRVLRFATGQWREIPFPEPAYSAGGGGTPSFDATRFRYSYTSMVTPSSVFDYDMEKGESILLKRQEVLGGYDPAKYGSERLWATARDGAKVPISIVARRDFQRNGQAPLLLYGYGSYGSGMSAYFSSNNLSLLDRGFAFAIAHVRGGNELGEAWHDEGMLMKKKNTFYDFIDCAEFLVKEKWTSPGRIVAEGGSAGGLLMGAVINLRPDLFRAVHAGVPFMDVINTMMDASLPLTVGEYLEWGNPNEKAAFDYMLSYSPYDNLERKAYPAILVTTSYNDSQVMYWEPAKYVAKLRTLKTDKNPLLLKTKMDPAGHGGASGRYDALKDKAFELAWMLSQVGITR